MSQVYFHCSNSREVRVDQLGAMVSDLTEARDYAACVVRSLIMERSAEDWRDWADSVSARAALAAVGGGVRATTTEHKTSTVFFPPPRKPHMGCAMSAAQITL